MDNTYHRDFARAEKALLTAARIKVQSSYKVITRAAKTKPPIPLDTIRAAYWHLVGEGWLVREPDGVRTLRKGESPVEVD